MSHFQCVTKSSHLLDKDPLQEPEVFAEDFRVNGDTKSLERLFQAFRHLIFLICFKILKNRHDAEDVTNDMYIVLNDKLKENQVEYFKAWLSQMTRNKCYNIIRDRGRERDRFEKFKIESPSFMESGRLWGLRGDNDISNVIKRCLKKLSSEQQQCLEGFFYDERSYHELADHLGLSYKQVKSHLQNGRRKLAILVKAELQNIEQ